MPSNLNQFEVIENGEVVEDKNKMRPDVMQFLMLASIASQAVRIRKYFDDRESQGWIQNFDNVPVTPVRREFHLDFPAQSLSITNDAPLPPAPPVAIWVVINNPAHTRRTLNPGETLNINFETHKLERFFVQCPPGLAAPIRATARG